MRETNKVVNDLIDVFAGKVMTSNENEVLYMTVRHIHDLQDQSNLYKSMLVNQQAKTNI